MNRSLTEVNRELSLRPTLTELNRVVGEQVLPQPPPLTCLAVSAPRAVPRAVADHGVALLGAPARPLDLEIGAREHGPLPHVTKAA